MEAATSASREPSAMRMDDSMPAQPASAASAVGYFDPLEHLHLDSFIAQRNAEHIHPLC